MRQYTLFQSDEDRRRIQKDRLDAIKGMVPQPNYQGPMFNLKTGEKTEEKEEEVPKWVADEIKATWRAMKSCDGQLEAYRICERMVDRLGFGRRDDNPPLT